MPCPNCDSINLDVIEEQYFPDHHIEVYKCNECDTVFRWESHRTIEQEPEEKEDDFNKGLKELPKKKEKAAQLALEEEIWDEI